MSRFPSAAGGRGFKPLADDVHRQGLKFGVHIVRGIPRLAVERNTPIEGTPFHAADIADKTDFCDWNEDQWGVDVKKPGAQAWYDSLFRQLAGWGVDLRQGRRPLLPGRGDRHDPPGHRPDRPAHRAQPVLRTDARRTGRRPGEERQHVAAARRPLGLLGPGPAGLPASSRVDAVRRAGPLARSGHAAARPPAGPAGGLVEERDQEPGLFRDGLPRRPGGRGQLPDPRRAEDGHDASGPIARCPLMFGGHLPASDAWTALAHHQRRGPGRQPDEPQQPPALPRQRARGLDGRRSGDGGRCMSPFST
ncbi:MAG: hypothetical protein MZV63_13405 [Marinilabiliales bacterium]|nr:hypothetical protein [Marinilabiliales bacterium]